MTIIFYPLGLLYTKVVAELKFHSGAILARSKRTLPVPLCCALISPACGLVLIRTENHIFYHGYCQLYKAERWRGEVGKQANGVCIYSTGLLRKVELLFPEHIEG